MYVNGGELGRSVGRETHGHKKKSVIFFFTIAVREVTGGVESIAYGFCTKPPRPNNIRRLIRLLWFTFENVTLTTILYFT